MCSAPVGRSPVSTRNPAGFLAISISSSALRCWLASRVSAAAEAVTAAEARAGTDVVTGVDMTLLLIGMGTPLVRQSDPAETRNDGRPEASRRVHEGLAAA